MGPYYRGTSQGMGTFFNLFYQHPLLMLLVLLSAAVVGVWWWRKTKSRQSPDT